MLDIFLLPYPFFCIRIFALSHDPIFAAITKQLLIICTRDVKISSRKTAPERLPSELGLRL